MKNKNFIFLMVIVIFFTSCATTNVIKEYPKWPDKLVPFFNESINSNIGVFYFDFGRGIESGRSFSTPNNNGPSLIVFTTTSISTPNMNYSSTFELVSIGDNGGKIVGKCILSSGMAQSSYTKGQLYTLCDSYELIGEGVDAELTLIGGTMGSKTKFKLISQ
jgi:hypothetical protein